MKPEVRRSERTRHEPDRYEVWLMDHHDLLIIKSDQLTSFEEAMMGPGSNILLEASISELESLF